METIEALCCECNRETNQDVHARFKGKPEKDEDENITYYEEYLIIECRGCNYTGFLYYSWSDQDDEKHEEYYPERVITYHKGDYLFLNEEEKDELPRFIFNIYEELVATLDNEEANTLAGVGLRMVVEAVCIHQKIEGSNLKDKIANLETKGFISKLDHAIIDKLREIGNMSAHSIKPPSTSILNASLEAINHLLRTVYITRKRTKNLLKKTKLI